ncbi:unnamed protein product [Sympodiomycopsis kandeliae]
MEHNASSSSSSPSSPPADPAATDPSAPPETVQMTDKEEEELNAMSEKDNSDSGKLKTLMGVLKKMVGVKDMAAIRLSLPANLLEPIPNLEYWNYLDRADLFTSIGELNNPLDRFLQVLRFTFTKELKFIHGKICKPYNSILGEHFRCHWDISQPVAIDSVNGQILPRAGLRTSKSTPLALASNSSASSSAGSRPSSIRSTTNTSSKNLEVPNTTQASSSSSPSTSTDDSASAGKKARAGLSRFISREKIPKQQQQPQQSSSSSANASASASLKSPSLNAQQDNTLSNAVDGLSLSDSNSGSSRRVCFLTEQVSHHPPISSFFVECKDTGVQLCGVDQLSAKFTGTAIKVFPGEHNKGIFVKLTGDSPLGNQVDGEEYQITHPTASINGLLRGSLWVAICDTLYITCRGGNSSSSSDGGKNTRLRSVIEYKDESWLSKAKYALEGVIYEYEWQDGQSEEEQDYKTVRDVPSDKVVAHIEGSWRGKIFWRKKGDKDNKLLINLEELNPLPKTVRPLKSQDTYESRLIWESVTSSILEKNFSQATKNKQKIEQQQRNLALDRKNRNEEFRPQFFDEDISNGRPRLNDQGREAIQGERELKGYSNDTRDNVPEDTKEKRDTKAVKEEDSDDDDDDNGSFRSAED